MGLRFHKLNTVRRIYITRLRSSCPNPLTRPPNHLLRNSSPILQRRWHLGHSNPGHDGDDRRGVHGKDGKDGEAHYYIAMYFAESNDNASEFREFGIGINGVTYHPGIRLTRDGIAVFATKWPLSGPTTISLTPSAESALGPLINGGEVFEVVTLGGQTFTRDGMFTTLFFYTQFRESDAIVVFVWLMKQALEQSI